MQTPQPLGLCLAVLAEVEAGHEDAQGEVGVGAQEAGDVLGAVVAGAPGGEPGDSVAAARVQVPSCDVSQEENFHMAAHLRETGRDTGTASGGGERAGCKRGREGGVAGMGRAGAETRCGACSWVSAHGEKAR